jgi:cation diffusion facilitator CzcD-associated flavoprotein CzcO
MQANLLPCLIMDNNYDAIVIGTGAGGGTLALHLAQAGKKILVIERGPFMPQEKLNWDTSAVFLDNRYHTKETWQDKDGKPLHPQQAYFVGGQTKVYGAAMFRMLAGLRLRLILPSLSIRPNIRFLHLRMSRACRQSRMTFASSAFIRFPFRWGSS